MTSTKISWADKVWNPIRGCSRVSAGCEHCYAERTAGRFAGTGLPYEGLTRKTANGPRWTGDIRLVAEKLADPLKWRKPQRVFVASMSDPFHRGVPFEFVAAIFGVMAACPQHTFQLLTKRPERMLEFFGWMQTDVHGREAAPQNMAGAYASLRLSHARREAMCATYPWRWPLPNLHIGVSVEDQATASERIPLLLRCPAALWWISAEPLLSPLDLAKYLPHGAPSDGLQGPKQKRAVHIRHVIVGGESGPGHRPCNPEWIADIAGQCVDAGVPVFVKQDSGPRAGMQGRICDDVWELKQMPGES